MALLIAVGVIAFLAVPGFRTAQQYERALVFRFGRYTGTRGPGLFWIIPLGVEKRGESRHARAHRRRGETGIHDAR